MIKWHCEKGGRARDGAKRVARKKFAVRGQIPATVGTGVERKKIPETAPR